MMFRLLVTLNILFLYLVMPVASEGNYCPKEPNPIPLHSCGCPPEWTAPDKRLSCFITPHIATTCAKNDAQLLRNEVGVSA